MNWVNIAQLIGAFAGGAISLFLLGLWNLKRRRFPKSELMKGLFSSLGHSINIEDYQDDMFGYYYTLFKYYKQGPKSPMGEAAVLQMLYLCYKLYRAYNLSTETIQHTFGGLNNLAKDFPAVQDFLANDGMKIVGQYQNNIGMLNKQFDQEFMEFIESQYAQA